MNFKVEIVYTEDNDNNGNIILSSDINNNIIGYNPVVTVEGMTENEIMLDNMGVIIEAEDIEFKASITDNQNDEEVPIGDTSVDEDHSYEMKSEIEYEDEEDNDIHVSLKSYCDSQSLPCVKEDDSELSSDDNIDDSTESEDTDNDENECHETNKESYDQEIDEKGDKSPTITDVLNNCFIPKNVDDNEF